VPTRALVDSSEELDILEELIETRKPPSSAPRRRALHFLLHTPFRYPPLRHGSRFGSATEPSLWYGSKELETAFGETAYYRLLFLEGTSAVLAPVHAVVTAFRAEVATPQGIDLTRPPFAAYRGRISSKSDYRASQALGTAMREAGVQAFRYASARVEGGTNAALLSVLAFASPAPASVQNWFTVTDRAGMELTSLDVFRRRHLRFARSSFEVAGRLPQPAP
jgi:hypothetical protein